MNRIRTLSYIFLYTVLLFAFINIIAYQKTLITIFTGSDIKIIMIQAKEDSLYYRELLKRFVVTYGGN